MMRSPRRLVILFIAICILLVIWMSLSHVMMKRYPQSGGHMIPYVVEVSKEQANSKNLKGFTDQSFRVVHLDLKGAPPLLQYLRKLLPVLAEQGADCLLIEYEDMFPYMGTLANISAKNAYTVQEIRRILSWAHDLGLEVIPLVQTFGHLEHVLKLEEWKSLREMSSFPQELCPSNPASLPLIEEMLSQVMTLHKGSIKYIHLGADEVFHIGACVKCSYYPPWEIYNRHVTQVAELVHRKYPGVTPIIWDDMIRSWGPKFLTTTSLTTLVEPMVWAYAPDVTALVPHYIWHWYSTTFRRIWIAGAFKGATLPTTDLPDLETHYRNTLSWLKYASSVDVQIAGFVLTGWSRFDHFAVLCELLPVSMPSLFLSLVALSRKHIYKSEQEKFPTWRRNLKCTSSTDFTPYSIKQDQNQIVSCEFLGSDLFSSILNYVVLKIKTESLYVTLKYNKGWMTQYNIKHNFTNPFRILETFTSLKSQSLLNQLFNFKNRTRLVLLNYFDSYSTEEWLSQKIVPLEDKINELSRTMESLMLRDAWPRRPLT